MGAIEELHVQKWLKITYFDFSDDDGNDLSFTIWMSWFILSKNWKEKLNNFSNKKIKYTVVIHINFHCIYIPLHCSIKTTGTLYYIYMSKAPNEVACWTMQITFLLLTTLLGTFIANNKMKWKKFTKTAKVKIKHFLSIVIFLSMILLRFIRARFS